MSQPLLSTHGVNVSFWLDSFLTNKLFFFLKKERKEKKKHKLTSNGYEHLVSHLIQHQAMSYSKAHELNIVRCELSSGLSLSH